MVGAAIAGCREPPDVARVLTEPVTDPASRLEFTQTGRAVGVGAEPAGSCCRRCRGVGRRSASGEPAGMRLADGVEVEEVAGLLGEDVDHLPGAGQSVSD